MEFDETCINFKWSMTNLIPGLTLGRYQLLGPMQGERHSSVFYAGFSFADILISLRTEYGHLFLKEGKITVSNVSDSYAGGGRYGSFILESTP